MNQAFAVLAGVALLPATRLVGDAPDFKKEVRPILEANCLKCHGAEKPKGDLSLVTLASTLKGGHNGIALVPKDPAKSPLYVSTTLPATDDNAMPPKGDRLSAKDQGTLKAWIEAGAPWPEEFKLAQKDKIDFNRDVKPIIEVFCVQCHKEGHAKGDLRLDVKSEFFKSKDIVIGDALSSKLFTSMILPVDHDDLMPPKSKGGPLPRAKADIIAAWIDQGAEWPEGVVLSQKEAASLENRDFTAMYDAIYAKLAAQYKAENPGAKASEPYTEPIPGTPVSFDMLPIPGGDYVMGSPSGEAKRKADEGPQVKKHIDPFWMGKYEVTWNEYEMFMFPALEKGTNVPTERVDKELWIAYPELTPGTATTTNVYIGKEADAVSRPTTPYVEMSFGMGKDGFPAISMTHYAAVFYCRWLSAKTGHFYRLATEAEWEYACRAGTTTAYSFGDDASKLGEYAWNTDNSDGKYQKVGKKKPNPWGLYDMHGNVSEWVLDAYVDSYDKVGDQKYVPGKSEYPHVSRGGSWDDEADLLRSSARKASEPAWKMRDPQLPKSKWYLTDAQFQGMRIIRPLAMPTREEMEKAWTSFPKPKP
ncbi:MAG TPA: SUMF1/EgtB/PvdO family nonheme iron enzyme [Candidatus Limnocylindria bacterium]|nr:SUMF1/EgtB/PvdO family nonheme iron enzyme [Candidatus Limnocylindria bacterium]